MKAKKLPQNWADALYERIVAVRRAELAMAELCRLDYEDVYQCHGCGSAILDNKHSFIDSQGNRYHSRDCADVAEVTDGRS